MEKRHQHFGCSYKTCCFTPRNHMFNKGNISTHLPNEARFGTLNKKYLPGFSDYFCHFVCIRSTRWWFWHGFDRSELGWSWGAMLIFCPNFDPWRISGADWAWSQGPQKQPSTHECFSAEGYTDVPNVLLKCVVGNSCLGRICMYSK